MSEDGAGMSDERAFAWMRGVLGPFVGEITVVMNGDGDGKRIIMLERATDEQATRLHNAIAIQFPGLRFEVKRRTPNLAGRSTHRTEETG